jgi:hypothetical protein
MSHLSKVEIPVLHSFELSITPPSSVTMSGTIAIPDPGQELSVDVRGLTFVNSSAIRLFVDWSSWVGAARERGYVLRFRTDRRITWQRTSFAVLQSLGGKAVSVTSE